MDMRKRIRTEMEAQGLNLKSLSLKAQLSETYVRDFLEGRSQDPKLSKIQAVADALGKSLAWLTEGAESAEVVSIMPSLDKARRAQLTEYARFLAAQAKADSNKK
jgi:transcriptional regulator with XRE-family HTH domain